MSVSHPSSEYLYELPAEQGIERCPNGIKALLAGMTLAGGLAVRHALITTSQSSVKKDERTGPQAEAELDLQLFQQKDALFMQHMVPLDYQDLPEHDLGACRDTIAERLCYYLISRTEGEEQQAMKADFYDLCHSVSRVLRRHDETVRAIWGDSIGSKTQLELFSMDTMSKVRLIDRAISSHATKLDADMAAVLRRYDIGIDSQQPLSALSDIEYPETRVYTYEKR